MKKRTLFLLLPFLFSIACHFLRPLPYGEGDSAMELYDFLKRENVEYSSSGYSVIFFRYEDRNYIVTEALYADVITKIKGYRTYLPSIYDFYQLKLGMDIYDVAERVGAPKGYIDEMSSFAVFYDAKDGKQVGVGYTEICGHALFDGRIHMYETKIA